VGQEPEEIRAEIVETRARMTETIEAIGHKTDVKERTRDKVREAATEARARMRENPFGVVLGAAVAGIVAGFAIPSKDGRRAETD
jgi:ElaB/YqjD/DUF883 family membrane-anchored ribosome-binding protein